ncbi:MAG: SMP-30/gluconolactonase/LRE family protein [Alphaproteobacteria bacterium GM202ARS2]|nr:SMP-30/gluconolactonase/LRE family protein [Alphaproteobacteria bacterium GM202ARS2]
MPPITPNRIVILAFVLILAVWGLATCGEPSPFNVTEVWSRDGFATPESALYDEERDVTYVSLMDGGAIEKNGKGRIVVIDEQGKTLRTLAEGLNAPKGMALYQNTLYVSDIDRIAVIDVDDGTTTFVAVADSMFLNDVEVDTRGLVYVSDMLTGIIHTLPHGKGVASLGALPPTFIAHPNGLFWDGETLIIASWGMPLNDDFTTDQPGRLYRYDPRNDNVTILSERFGNLDGIAVDEEGHMLITDWINGGLFAYVDGTIEELIDLPSGSADLGYHRRGDFFIIPLMKDDRLVALKVEENLD